VTTNNPIELFMDETYLSQIYFSEKINIFSKWNKTHCDFVVFNHS